jgi:hypothetical protein
VRGLFSSAAIASGWSRLWCASPAGRRGLREAPTPMPQLYRPFTMRDWIGIAVAIILAGVFLFAVWRAAMR